jgi:hypothetical protein
MLPAVRFAAPTFVLDESRWPAAGDSSKIE